MSIQFLSLDVHAAVTAVCPIDGVSIGSPADKSTWQIHFSPTATPAQQAAAATAVANFNTAAPDRDDQFAADTNRQAMIAAIQNATPTQIATFVNNNVTDLTSAKAMLVKILLLVARTISQ